MISFEQHRMLSTGQTLTEVVIALGTPDFREGDVLAYKRDDGMVDYLTFVQDRLFTMKEQRA